MDMKMATEIAELDLIVGGHSHSFLFTGETLPSVEKPEGITKITSTDGQHKLSKYKKDGVENLSISKKHQ